MIDHETRNAIYLLCKKGISVRQISRQLGVARNSVRTIIKAKGETPTARRSDRIEVDPELLKELYNKCDGWKERMHEMLEEKGIQISYSTLTSRVRELGLGRTQSRCGQVDDEPGQEMQHDTSPYQLKIGGSRIKVTASLIYFRYCKQRYLRFYRHFTRFHMKCFFHEALTHYGYAGATCIIDNTNLAVAHGTGPDAVMHLEMAKFLERYGSRFEAHHIGHSNRKAGNERSFWTVETNFFPGRDFESLEDLNRQAFEWATIKMANRPQTDKKIIPNVVFEEEKPYLKKLLPHLPKPYRVHKDRTTDQYGHAAFGGNYYWVPGTSRHSVMILEYADSIKIFHQRRELIEYKLPPFGTKAKRIKPPGAQSADHLPRNQKQPTREEESELRGLGEEVSSYLDFALSKKGLKRHLFIRDLHRLSRRGDKEAFKRTAARCLHYRVFDLGVIERIFIYYLNANNLEPIRLNIDTEYQDRESFRQGELSERPDISVYDKLLDDEE